MRGGRCGEGGGRLTDKELAEFLRVGLRATERGVLRVWFRTGVVDPDQQRKLGRRALVLGSLAGRREAADESWANLHHIARR